MDNLTVATIQNNTYHSPTFTSNLAVTFVIAILLLVGAIGSILTMIVIAFNSSLHTKANYFIFSLCVSDFISAVICSPLWLYRRTWGFPRWEWGEEACKFYWASDFATNYVTSLHIMSFALLRFIAVKRPFQFSKITGKFVLYYLVALWVVSFIIAAPLFYIMGVELDRANAPFGSNNWPSCSIKIVDENCCVQQYTDYFTVISPLMFYLPDFAIIVLSLMITHQLIGSSKWRRRLSSANRNKDKKINSKSQTFTSTKQDFTDDVIIEDSETAVTKNAVIVNKVEVSLINKDVIANDANVIKTRNDVIATKNDITATKKPTSQPTKTMSKLERNTFTQLTLIVITFMIGYIPATVYLVWSGTTPDEVKGYGVDYWFGVMSYICLRFSECINPIMYSLGSTPIRKAIVRLLRKMCTCNRSGSMNINN